MLCTFIILLNDWDRSVSRPKPNAIFLSKRKQNFRPNLAGRSSLRLLSSKLNASEKALQQQNFLNNLHIRLAIL